MVSQREATNKIDGPMNERSRIVSGDDLGSLSIEIITWTLGVLTGWALHSNWADVSYLMRTPTTGFENAKKTGRTEVTERRVKVSNEIRTERRLNIRSEEVVVTAVEARSIIAFKNNELRGLMADKTG
ncbi:hypothetical protein KEM55_002889 [Ascosphaera atra]|nr:hypothetical protein KEM55_002889 [Ascosphaera atra]